MQLRLKSIKGMTLVEIIITMAFLAIILVSLFSMFTTAFSNLTSMGDRSKAAAEAQKIMDRIYEEARFTDTDGLKADVITILDDIYGSANYEDCTLVVANFDAPYNGKKVRFKFSEESEMPVDSATATPSVILKVFYRNGKHSVVLSSPIVNGSQ